MDGGVADARDGGEHACPVDLLLGLLTVSGTFDYELWEIDLPGSDIALYGWNDCRWERKREIATNWIYILFILYVYINVYILL